MKNSQLTSQRPHANEKQRAVVKKAIAEAVAVEREAMRQEKTDKQILGASDTEQKREEDDKMARVVKKTSEKKEPAKKVVKTAEVKEAVVENTAKAATVKETADETAKAAVKENEKAAAVKETANEVAKAAAKATTKAATAKDATAKDAEKEVAKETVKTKAAPAKKAVTEEIFVQFENNEILTKDIVEKVKAAYVAEGHAADSIKKVRVYIKPEEKMVYYVVNDEYASGIGLY